MGWEARNRIAGLKDAPACAGVGAPPILNVADVLMQVGADVANLLAPVGIPAIRVVLDNFHKQVAAKDEKPTERIVALLAVTEALADCQDRVRAALGVVVPQPPPEVDLTGLPEAPEEGSTRRPDEPPMRLVE